MQCELKITHKLELKDIPEDIAKFCASTNKPILVQLNVGIFYLEIKVLANMDERAIENHVNVLGAHNRETFNQLRRRFCGGNTILHAGSVSTTVVDKEKSVPYEAYRAGICALRKYVEYQNKLYPTLHIVIDDTLEQSYKLDTTSSTFECVVVGQ